MSQDRQEQASDSYRLDDVLKSLSRLSILELTRLYMAVDSEPDIFIKALIGLIEARSAYEITEETPLGDSEIIDIIPLPGDLNHELYGKIMAQRSKRQEEAITQIRVDRKGDE
jgi:hypothetical protein